MKIIGITSTALLSLLLGIAAPAYAQREPQGEKQDHPQQQQSKHEEAKPEKQQTKPGQEQAKPQRQPVQKQAQQAKPQRQPEQKQAQQAKPERQPEQKQAQQAKPQRQPEQRQTQQAKPQKASEPNQQLEQHAQQKQRQGQNHQAQQHTQQQNNQRPQRTQEEQRVQQSAWQQHRTQRWDSDHRTWQQRGGYSGYRIPDDRFRAYFGEGNEFRIYSLPFLVVGGYPRFQYNGYWISMVDPWPESWASDWYDTDDVYVVYVDNGYYLFNRRYPNIGMAISVSM